MEFEARGLGKVAESGTIIRRLSVKLNGNPRTRTFSIWIHRILSPSSHLSPQGSGYFLCL